MPNDQAALTTAPVAVLVELWALGLGHSLVIGHWSLGIKASERTPGLIQRQWAAALAAKLELRPAQFIASRADYGMLGCQLTWV